HDPFGRVLDADPREVSAFDRMHRVAPPAAEVAGVQPHEDGRQADERALALDGDVQLAQEEFLPLARGDGRLGLHGGSDVHVAYEGFAVRGLDEPYGNGSWRPASRNPLSRSGQESH